jgi:hypothetical protein
LEKHQSSRNSAEGDVVDPIEQHMAQIATSRQDAAIGQAKSREKMLASSIQKQPPVKVGDCVLIPVSEI